MPDSTVMRATGFLIPINLIFIVDHHNGIIAQELNPPISGALHPPVRAF